MRLDFAYLASSFLSTLPYLAVYLFGLVFAIINWSRFPKAAGLLALGIVILTVTMLFSGAFNTFLHDWIYERMEGARLLMGTLGFFHAVLEAVGTGLIIAAVFVGRTGPAASAGVLGTPGKPL